MNDQPTTASSEFAPFATSYFERLTEASHRIPLDVVEHLADALMSSWQDGRQVFIFGNGGSAGNAMHLANDWIYGISKTFGSGLRVTALPSNGSVTTCLANDEGYESIFSYQLAVLARPGDIAIALSGSGNSPNVVKALEYCKEADIESYAILGYSGGKALALADHPIHVAIDDMQISEDLQMTVGHLLMQWLYAKRGDIATTRTD
jgi:D-sedoheptulose 7-phosphate isomerase